MYHLRPATEADFATIQALIHKVQINPTGLDWSRFVLAVTEQGQIIGCGQVKPHKDGSLELASIAVEPEWRGKGIARAIIENLISANPNKRLFLTCRTSLQSLYERFGFRVSRPEEMTPYFRRLSRIANTVRFLHLLPEGILVMQREPLTQPD